jgi:hypothetical protein
VPAKQANSVSDEHNNFPSGHKELPQDNKLICLGEQKIASSVDQPHEDVADGIVSTPANSTNSVEDKIEESAVSVAENVARAEHQKEETCLSIGENTQNPGVTVKEINEKGMGADFGSNSNEESENLDTGENANRGSTEKVDMSEISTLYKKTEVVQREERSHTYEGMNVESHEALIEELERSLSFSSDDEYFSDEAETSGLSDALRRQMGSRRFILRGKMNGTSRNDPHGQLIEELEMSFSDAEEPMEQHVMVADRIDGNKHGKHTSALDAESANPCEESILSLDNGNFEPEKMFHQENSPIDNDNQGREDVPDDNNIANGVHGDEHDKHLQTLGPEITLPCEESIPSLDNGDFEPEKMFHQENSPTDNDNQGREDIPEDNNTANGVHGDEHDKHLQTLGPEITHPCEESIPSQENRPIDNGDDRKKDIEDDNSAASNAHGNEHIAAADEIGEETFCDKEHDKDRHVDAEIVYPCERSIYLVDDSDIKFNKPILPNDSTVDSTQGKEEGCIDDGNMTNSIHGNENLVFADEDVAEKVHSNEELAFDHTRENEESHVEDDDPASYIHGEENAAVVDEYVADTIDKDEHGKDQQSLEAEFFITEHVKSEVIFQQKESVTDGIEQKVEYVMVDDNMTNSIQKDSAAVAGFSSWSNKRSQCRLPSFNKDKEQVPYKYRGSQVRQGLPLDAEDFRSIHHFIEPQVDGTSSSLSSGSPSQGSSVHRTSSKFNNIVRNERLKKMDELRDKLSRLSSQKGMEKWSQKRGLEYQQQSNSYDVEQHLHSVDADSIPSSCAQSYYCHERPPMYQPSNHFSPTQTYPHCHFGHAQANIPFNYDMWEFNSYYQSSYAESTVPDHDSLMLSYKDPKRVARKHILRPLSGASPFSICSSCFNLIQMPSDMYISKSKVGKMQCGKCAKVLVLSFHSDSVIAKNKDATSHSAECLRGPVSINEEYRASFTRSFSTQAGAGLAATQSGKKVSDSALHRLMGYDSASQLLRYSRPLDDGYDRFDSMVPVSSRVSQRKNM